MKKYFPFLVLIAAIVFLTNCGKDNSLEKLRENELKRLDEFIQKNYPNVARKPSGLYYIEEEPGTGDTIQIGDRVQVYYATWTIDSVLIDESSGFTVGQRYEPLEFIAGAEGSVIDGLNEAAMFMRKGTKAHLVIPSELAYGQNGSGSVGGFATLLMEVEVYKVYPSAVQ